MDSISSLTALPIPVSQDAHRFAKLFAKEQATPEKGKQVYLNTLAVVAVRDYLKWLSIDTAIDQGDCWHPVKRAMFNIADLVIPHVGKLECLPILPNSEEQLEIPPEVTDNRLGYIAVQFAEELQQVELLGFLPIQKLTYPPQPIPLNQLQPLDQVIDTLDWHRKWANLWQQFSQPTWQPLDLLLTPGIRRAVRTTMRSGNLRVPAQSFSRGKLIEWEKDNLKSSFILAVKVSDQSTEEVDLKIRLYAYEENAYLPAGLEISVLDESGVACMNAQTGETDGWIQLGLGCQPQEEFQLKIVLENQTIIETFRV
ncbi:MAG: DUF1822 family protein [Cyanobacteria bacterium J06592_8]